MPSGVRHPLTMTLRSDPSAFTETNRPSTLASRKNRRPLISLAAWFDSAMGVAILLSVRWNPQRHLNRRRLCGDLGLEETGANRRLPRDTLSRCERVGDLRQISLWSEVCND